MTQTVRRTSKTSPGVRRMGRVYAYDTLRVDSTGMPTAGTEVGYVGKSVQPLAARDDQHRGLAPGPDGTPAKCQPFSDVIVGSIRVVEQGMWTEDELADRETFHIHRLKPRYNFVENLSNPERIPIPVARRHRDNRDLARGLTPRDWAPCRPDVRRSRLPLKWRRRRDTTLAWSGGWLGFSLALWAVLAVAGRHTGVAWQVWPVLSGAVCGVPVAVKVRSVWRRSGVRRTLRRWT